MAPIIKLIIIIFIIAIVASTITMGISSSFGSNPVKDAASEATAAVIYARMTPSMQPTPTPYGTPTISLYEVGLTEMVARPLTQQAHEESIGLTQQANDQALEREKFYAQQQADFANATAVAAGRTAVAVDAQRTAWAQSTQVQGTANAYGTQVQSAANAQATSTQQALVFIQQTAAAYANETQVAAQSTAAVYPTHAIWTQEAIYVVQTVEAAQARDVELSIQRTEWTNIAKAWGPWVLLLAVAYVGGRGFSTWVKMRIHGRDEHGRAPILQRELPDGGVVIFRPEQMETGIVKVTGDGNVIRYSPMDKQEQANINRGNQITDIVAALPTPYARTGQNLLSKFAGGSAGTPSVDIVDEARSLGPVLDEAEGKVIGGE